MITIILAGGLGKRMKLGNYPKVLIKVKGIPMLIRTINNAILLKSEMILIVIGPQSEERIKSTVKKYVKNTNIFYVVQKTPLGTADALKTCVPFLEEIDPFEKVLILNSNMPLLSVFTLNTFIKWKNDNDSRILASKVNNPHGYGRILRDNKLNFLEIKEDKECNEDEKKIKHINTGIYMVRNLQILENIMNVKNNNIDKEYYITDLINMIKPSVYMLEEKFNRELTNVNDQDTLKKIEKMFNN